MHDSAAGDSKHRSLGILLDESTESSVVKAGSTGIGISRTVFTKLDDFVTEDKTRTGYRMEGGKLRHFRRDGPGGSGGWADRLTEWSYGIGL